MEQKIKNYLGVAILITVLAFGFSALSYVYTYSRSTEPNNYRSFSVTGEGETVLVPDVAMFGFKIITQGGSDLGALQEENTKKANGAIGFAKSKGIADKDIKTQTYHIEPRYQTFNCNSPILGGVSACPPAEIVGYLITQSVQIKIRDFTKIGDLVSGIVEHGANSISGLEFTLDDPARAQSEARAEAIAHAKEKAESIARAGGFRLGKLLSIDEGGYPQPYYDAYGKGGAEFSGIMAQAIPPRIEPGSEEVRITVTLQYEIR